MPCKDGTLIDRLWFLFIVPWCKHSGDCTGLPLSYICICSRTHGLVGLYRTESEPATHCLAGWSRAPVRGRHQPLPRLRSLGLFLNSVCVRLPHTAKSQLRQQTQHFPAAPALRSAHLWLHMLDLSSFFPVPNAWAGMRSSFFPNHGRLGDQDNHHRSHMPSICGVCFHL